MITHEPAVGCWIYTDGCSYSRELLPSDWDQAPFRIQGQQNVACRVLITGRTYQRKFGSYCVRVKLEIVGDGEPDRDVYGWMICF